MRWKCFSVLLMNVHHHSLVDSLHKGPVKQYFVVFFVVNLNKLSKNSTVANEWKLHSTHVMSLLMQGCPMPVSDSQKPVLLLLLFFIIQWGVSTKNFDLGLPLIITDIMKWLDIEFYQIAKCCQKGISCLVADGSFDNKTCLKPLNCLPVVGDEC